MARRPILFFLPRSRFLYLLIGVLFLFSAGLFTVVETLSRNLQDKVIVIDAGHGGQDPGAQFGGIKEKDINLDIAFRLKEVLTTKGCKVIMTREEDKDFFLPNFVIGRMAKRAELNERIRLATLNNADLFISIHANSFPGGNSYGMETYYHVQSAPGKALAERIHTQLRSIQPDNKRKEKSGDYYLLNHSKMPAVLIEVGFLSNHRELKLLQQDSYKAKIVDAVTQGIETYFKDYPFGVLESAQTLSKQQGPIPTTPNSYTLYYPSSQSTSLISEGRQATQNFKSLDPVQKVHTIISELLQGPKNQEGFFPIHAAQLSDVRFQNGIATLNFSKALKEGFSGGAAEEELAIKSIVWTTAQVGNIKGVRILVNGDLNDSIGGHITLNQTFTVQPPKAKISLVIDDFGINNPGTQEMLELGIPITAAVMPNLMFSTQEAELLHQKGYEIILHMPMEPKNGRPEWLGPGPLLTSLNPEEIRQRLIQGLDSVKYAVGISNHMGSRATESNRVVSQVIEVAKERGLLILDSKTSDATKLYSEANRAGLTAALRDVFLDNSNDLGAIKKQIHLLMELAEKNGTAIGIGHVGPQGPNTARAIREMMPEIEKHEIQVVPLSELIRVIKKP
jgi:N-acetylmuramoyl-L-alanine amidase